MDNYEKIINILRTEDRINWKSMISELVHEDVENHELIMNDDPDESIPILLESLDSTWTSGIPANTFIKDSTGKILFVNGYAPLDSRYMPDDINANSLRILSHGDTIDLIDISENELCHNEIYSSELDISKYTIIDESEVPQEFLNLLYRR